MAYRKLGMRSSTRQAMFKNIVTSLLKEERIETTETRAKELKRIADKMITLGKRSDPMPDGRLLRILQKKMW